MTTQSPWTKSRNRFPKSLYESKIFSIETKSFNNFNNNRNHLGYCRWNCSCRRQQNAWWRLVPWQRPQIRTEKIGLSKVKILFYFNFNLYTKFFFITNDNWVYLWRSQCNKYFYRQKSDSYWSYKSIYYANNKIQREWMKSIESVY